MGAAVLALAACASAGTPPDAPPLEGSGNAALGRVYAQTVCAACHAIGMGDMRSPDARARSFDAIANTPGLTRTALNAWLHSSHTNMPDLIVEPERVDDLHAYLLSLKRRD
jgi:mono/diheme cytochrome c family protein